MEEQYKAAIDAAIRLIDEGYSRLAREVLADSLEGKGEDDENVPVY